MTKVTMLYNNNAPIGFMMEGHAGYNPGGPDILCACLSAISQMTVNGVLDWTGLDIDETVKERSLKDGVLHFEIPCDMASLTSHQLFKSFEMYIEQLLEDYKNYITMERRYKS